jgi:hypothetical protein
MLAGFRHGSDADVQIEEFEEDDLDDDPSYYDFPDEQQDMAEENEYMRSAAPDEPLSPPPPEHIAEARASHNISMTQGPPTHNPGDGMGDIRGGPDTITIHRRDTYHAILNDPEDTPVLLKLDVAFLDDFMEIMADTISRYAHSDNPDEYMHFVVDWFGRELENDLDRSRAGCQWENLCPDAKFWERLQLSTLGSRARSRWAEFVELACYFVNAGCSEAAVERLLSRQKQIQGSSMTNVSVNVVTAKLQMYGPDVVLPGVHDLELDD